MIQLNTPATQTQSDIHPRLAALHRKYHELAHYMSSAKNHSMPSAATLVPSVGKSIAFDRPVVPIGQVMLCELSQQTDPDERLGEVGGCFQGYRATFRPRTLETLWEPEPWCSFPIGSSTYATAYDERLMRAPRLLDTLVGLAHLAQRLQDREPQDDWRLRLPQLLLGFDPSEPGLIERLSSRPTVAVRTHARANGLTIDQAWQELDSSTRVDDDITMTGLRLVDARLCANEKPWSDELPEVLDVFHDLRPLLGRQVTNPTRKLASQELSELLYALDFKNDHARVAQQVRRLLPWHISEGCTDGDLIAALRSPNGPLFAGRLAKRQGWSR